MNVIEHGEGVYADDARRNGDDGLYHVGEAVEVHSFGRWYVGAVASIGRTRVKVTYTTGTGTTRTKAFPASHVRPVSR